MKTTLYKIDNKGKTREWTIEIDGGKYRTTHGEKNGKLVTTAWTECVGKNVGRSNETTPAEQAKLEADAIVIKQQEKGYMDKPVKVHGGPMLAKKYEDFQKKLEWPVYSQPKLDGIRCVVDRQGMFSRNGKPIVAAPHIFEELKDIVKKYPDFVGFDGELYNHTLKHNFNKICSLVKRLKCSAEELEESKNIIEYWVYDWTDTSLIFSERYELLKSLVKGCKYVKLVPTVKISNQKELDADYEYYIEKGYEGQMVRIDDVYEDKRSKFLLKRKEFMTEEFEIVSIEEGLGNRAGMAGFARMVTKDGKEFKSNIKASWEELTDYLDNADDYEGKMATVQFFAYTPDGIPRFPYLLTVRDYE